MEAVDFIETELARFPAVLSDFKSAPFSRYKVTFTIEHWDKDAVWPITDQSGLEVVVAVFSRRVVGVPEPGVDVPQLEVHGVPIALIDGSWVVGSNGDGEDYDAGG